MLPDTVYHHLDGSQADQFFNFYESNEETLVPLKQKAFTGWFKKYWKRTGGASLASPSYFIFHDDYKSYDLKNERWIDEEEKWL